jgi:hypothetical protein
LSSKGLRKIPAFKSPVYSTESFRFQISVIFTSLLEVSLTIYGKDFDKFYKKAEEHGRQEHIDIDDGATYKTNSHNWK